MTDEELNFQTEIQMTQSKVELITNYYQFLESLLRQMILKGINENFIGLIELQKTKLDEKILFWYSV